MKNREINNRFECAIMNIISFYVYQMKTKNFHNLIGVNIVDNK